MPGDPKIPPDDELVEFFGVQPTLSNAGSAVPSYYQQLEFKITRGEYIVTCRIQPSCGDLALSILRDSAELVSIEVSSIVEYRIDREGDKSAFVATFSEASTATITLEHLAARWTLTQIYLDVTATVPGVAECDFVDATLRAKANCPIARALDANIVMSARLTRNE